MGTDARPCWAAAFTTPSCKKRAGVAKEKCTKCRINISHFWSGAFSKPGCWLQAELLIASRLSAHPQQRSPRRALAKHTRLMAAQLLINHACSAKSPACSHGIRAYLCSALSHSRDVSERSAVRRRMHQHCSVPHKGTPASSRPRQDQEPQPRATEGLLPLIKRLL